MVQAVKYYSHDEVKVILTHYGERIKQGEYSQKIKYDEYRSMLNDQVGIEINRNKLTNIEIKLLGPKANSTYVYPNTHDFVKFLHKYYMKPPFVYDYNDCEEEKDNMATYAYGTTNTNGTQCNRPELVYSVDTNGLTFTGSNAYINKDVLNKITSIDNSTRADVYFNDVSLTGSIETLTKEIETLKAAIDNNDRKEEDKMKGFNFDFGPCTDGNVRMSIYGLSIKNRNGEWVSYNPTNKQIVNVDVFNFDGGKFMYKMPVAISGIQAGDIIVHNKVPMFVIGIAEDKGSVIAVDPYAGEEKKVLLTHSPFGFDFVTKIVSMFSAFASTPTPDAPFGNFLPFMLMDNGDIDPMMLCMMMNQQNGGNMFSNPMMMYCLCSDKMKDNNMLPLMMMMGGNGFGAPATPNGK